MTSTNRRRFACLSLIMAAAPAVAQQTSDGTVPTGEVAQPGRVGQPDDIVVTGRLTFLSADTSGTTALPLPIEKVPQTINLVSNDFLRAADLKTIAEVADYTPGATNAGDKEGFNSQITLRGFAPAQALDGLNVGNVGADNFDRDYATVERLEIVQGPSSVVYGVSSPGGLVNTVSKGAGPQTRGYLSLQGGSFDSFRAEGQAAGSLTGDGSIRAIGIAAYDRAGSFMDVDHRHSALLYAGLNADIAPSVTGYVHGGYEHHRRSGFDGIPVFADGRPAPIPRSFFIGSKADNLKTDVWYTNAGLKWDASDLLEFNLKAQYQRATTSGTAPYGYDLQDDGTLSISGDVYHPRRTTDYGTGLFSVYKLDGIGLHDSFIAANVLYQVNRFTEDQGFLLFDGEDTGTVNIFDGDQAIRQLLDSATSTGNVDFTTRIAKTLTLATQAVLVPVDRLQVLLGASYSKSTIHSLQDGDRENYSPPHQWSYRAGVNYEVVRNAYVYLSYSESFQPQLRTDENNRLLAPLAGKQYETGVKYRALGGRLLLTAAAFSIDETNSATYTETIDGIDRFRALGKIRHRGVEVAALGKITPEWQVNAGYASLSAKVVKDVDPTVQGQRELFLPKNTASIFTTYTLDTGRAAGASAGAGLRFIGSEPTAYDGSSVPLKSYIVADASLGYTVHDWLIQLNLKNLFDKRYYVNTYKTLFYGNIVGEPRSAQLTLRRNF